MPRRHFNPKHTPFVFNPTCQSKRKFATEKDALVAVELQELMTPTLKLRVYHCPQCSKWHLSSIKN